MSEINVIDNLSGIEFSREKREKVAEVLAAFIADQVAAGVAEKVLSESAADKIGAEQAPALESTSVPEPAPAPEPVDADKSKRSKKSRR